MPQPTNSTLPPTSFGFGDQNVLSGTEILAIDRHFSVFLPRFVSACAETIFELPMKTSTSPLDSATSIL